METNSLLKALWMELLDRWGHAMGHCNLGMYSPKPTPQKLYHQGMGMPVRKKGNIKRLHSENKHISSRC